MRRAWVIGLAAVALAGCGTSDHGHETRTAHGGRSGKTSAATTGSSSPSTRRMTPRVELARFAVGYAAYLDGRVPTSRLTGLTATARGQLGPPIPRRLRASRVTVVSLHLAPLGSPSEVVLRDGRHHLPIAVRVGQSAGGDVVASVQAPDLDSVLQRPSKRIVEPRGSAPAERAARRFLAGYLPWVYGRGKTSAITAITPHLRRALRGRSLPQSSQAPNLHPRVAAVGMRRAGVHWTADVNIADAERTYDMALTLVRVDGRWVVSTVREPR